MQPEIRLRLVLMKSTRLGRRCRLSRGASNAKGEHVSDASTALRITDAEILSPTPGLLEFSELVPKQGQQNTVLAVRGFCGQLCQELADAARYDPVGM